MLKLGKKSQQNWDFLYNIQNYQLSQITNNLKNYFVL